MKPFAHVFWLALGIGLAGLLAGCTTPGHRTAQRIEPARDFEVVETSARRPLTDKEMSELRGTVGRYLEEQGQTDSGDYYLKVYLTPDTADTSADWVVVRFTRYTDTRVAVAAAYPAFDSYGSYYSYDTYPYGYGSFGRISLQYYDDPFYRSRYYYPRRNWRDRDHDHHRLGDHKPGDRPPGGVPPPSGNVSNRPPRPENPHRRTPDRIAPNPNNTNPQVVTRPPGTDDSRRQYRPAGVGPSSPRPAGQGSPDRQWRGRNEANTGTPRPPSAPRTEARNDPPRSSQPSYQPPAPDRTPDRTPPASGSSNSDRRDDGRRGGNLP